MKEVKQSVTKPWKHQKANCFLFALVCHGMEEGWLLDTNRRRASRLDELTADLCTIPSLEGKPKVLLVEEYESSAYSAWSLSLKL